MKEFLSISAAGAVLILVISALRLLFQHRVSRRVWLLLWGFAVLRLLIPVTVSSRSSVYNLPVFEMSTRAPQSVQVPISSDATVMQEIVLPQDTETKESVALEVIWITGVIVTFGVFMGVHFFSRRKYRFSVPLPSELCVPSGLRVRQLDGLDAPVTYGVFRPTVLLPVGLQDSSQLEHILLHEKAHIQCHDILKKYILLIAVSLHWFNPAVWLMLYLASQDMEMRCDAIAVQTLGSKTDYARTLVDAEAARLRGLILTGFSFNSTAGRLKALIKWKSRPVLSAVIGVVLAVVVLFCFMTGRSVKAHPNVSEPISTETVPFASKNEKTPLITTEEPMEESTQEITQESTQETTQETTQVTTTQRTQEVTQETTASASEVQVQPTESTPPYSDAKPSDNLYYQPTQYLPSTMQLGDTARIDARSHFWLTFVSDRPDVVHLQVRSEHSLESKYVITAHAIGVGQANIYYVYNGTYYYLQTVTVESTDGKTSVDFSDADSATNPEVLPSLTPGGIIGDIIGGEEP